MFKRFIDDGFGIIRGNKKDVGTQINEFYQLRENIFINKWTVGNYVAYMDLYIFKEFFRYRNIEYKSISKTCESLHVYSIQKRPYKTYNKKLCLRSIKTIRQDKYLRTQLPKNQKHFFLRMTNRGFNKNMLAKMVLAGDIFKQSQISRR